MLLSRKDFEKAVLKDHFVLWTNFHDAVSIAIGSVPDAFSPTKPIEDLDIKALTSVYESCIKHRDGSFTAKTSVGNLRFWRKEKMAIKIENTKYEPKPKNTKENELANAMNLMTPGQHFWASYSATKVIASKINQTSQNHFAVYNETRGGKRGFRVVCQNKEDAHWRANSKKAAG